MRFSGRDCRVSLSRMGLWAALVACASHGGGQPLMTASGQAETMMSTRSPSVDKDIQMGNAYLSGHGVLRDEKQAAYWFEKAAEAGDPWAQQQIGFFYQAGIGVAVDPARAAHWYQLAAASGLAGAKTNLGVSYLWGVGVPMDKTLAADLFRQAASKGNGTAATYLGDLYYFGEGVQKDRVAAEHWYHTGAKLHDPVAEFDLGELYSTENHAQDPAKAAQWFRKSIAGGYIPALHSLALLLAAHPELGHAKGEFITLFEEASAWGQWKSSEALGIIYRDGIVTPRDPGNAYYYLRLAALQGAPTPGLETNLLQLSGELGPQETARLNGKAQGWFALHHEAVEFLVKKGAKEPLRGMGIVTPEAGLHAGQLIPAPEGLD